MSNEITELNNMLGNYGDQNNRKMNSEAEQKLFDLVTNQGMTIKEASERLCISYGAAYYSVTQERMRLKKVLSVLEASARKDDSLMGSSVKPYNKTNNKADECLSELVINQGMSIKEAGEKVFIGYPKAHYKVKKERKRLKKGTNLGEIIIQKDMKSEESLARFYNRTEYEIKENLLKLMIEKGKSIKEVSEELSISYATAEDIALKAKKNLMELIALGKINLENRINLKRFLGQMCNEIVVDNNDNNKLSRLFNEKGNSINEAVEKLLIHNKAEGSYEYSQKGSLGESLCAEKVSNQNNKVIGAQKDVKSNLQKEKEIIVIDDDEIIVIDDDNISFQGIQGIDKIRYTNIQKDFGLNTQKDNEIIIIDDDESISIEDDKLNFHEIEEKNKIKDPQKDGRIDQININNSALPIENQEIAIKDISDQLLVTFDGIDKIIYPQMEGNIDNININNLMVPIEDQEVAIKDVLEQPSVIFKETKVTIWSEKDNNTETKTKSKIVGDYSVLMEQATLEIEKIIEENCKYTLDQLQMILYDRIGVKLELALINNALESLKVIFRSSSCVLDKVNEEFIVSKRAEYAMHFVQHCFKHIDQCIFIHESGFDFHLNKTTEQSIGEVNTPITIPTMKNKSQTLILAISRKGVVHYTFSDEINKSTNFDKFIIGLTTILNKDQSMHGFHIILDDTRIHGAEIARKVLSGTKHQLHFLSPYSYMLNPSELFFSFIKGFIRTCLSSNLDMSQDIVIDVKDIIDYAISTVSKLDCIEYFDHMMKNLLLALQRAPFE